MFQYLTALQEEDAPPRQPGVQDMLSMLVSGGMAQAAPAAETAADGDGAQPAADAQEQRTRALEQLFDHFRDAFGGDNGAQTTASVSHMCAKPAVSSSELSAAKIPAETAVKHVSNHITVCSRPPDSLLCVDLQRKGWRRRCGHP